MKKEIIENTLRFLQRVDLKWNEVPAFVECINALNEELKRDTQVSSENKE